VVTVRSGVASDTGAARKANEDAVFAGRRVFVVADGMGGHAAGDVASALAVERLARLDERDDLKPDDVREQLFQANQDILDAARRSAGRAGMGATVVVLALAWFAGSRHWTVFNAGDCRVYRFAGDILVQLTVDHTEVAQMVAAGALDPEDARVHPRRHVVTKALGSDPAPEPDAWMLPPVAGETFLLCSDGLNLELSDLEIASILRTTPAPEQAATALVEQALKQGGRDNVSVVVVANVVEEQDATADERTIPRGTGTERS
jgi:PPM family protein phosphatase